MHSHLWMGAILAKWKMYFFELQNIFVQISEYICQNCLMYLFKIYNLFVDWTNEKLTIMPLIHSWATAILFGPSWQNLSTVCTQKVTHASYWCGLQSKAVIKVESTMRIDLPTWKKTNEINFDVLMPLMTMKMAMTIMMTMTTMTIIKMMMMISVSRFGSSCSPWLEPVGFLSILPFWTI